MKLIDTNLIIRFLMQDNEEQYEIARKTMEEGAFIIPEIIPETLYVLSGYYNVPRKKLSDALIVFLDNVSIENRDVVKEALRKYGSSTLDYVDCILVARHKLLGDEVVTFDKKLNKALEDYD